MRVLLVSRGDVFPPVHGAAVKIVRTAEALSRAGCTVVFVSDDRGSYHVFERGGVKRVVVNPDGVGDRGVRPRLNGFLGFLGVPEDDRFLYSPVFDTAFWRRTAEIARLEAIEVAHAEFPGFLVPALAARAVTGCPTVLVEHNVEHRRIVDSAGISKRVQDRLESWEVALCRLADRVVTVSEQDRSSLVAGGVPASKLRVVPHGVDLEMYGPHLAEQAAARRMELGLGPSDKVVFFHGVLNYPPNMEAVYRLVNGILPRLDSSIQNVKLVIAGKYPPQGLKQPNLLFLGCVPPESLAPTIALADVAVVPLVGGGGTRMKILEYFAAEVPVVSTAKGAEGMCLNGDELVIAKSDQEIADAVIALLNQPEKASAMAARARSWVRDYSWDAAAIAYMDIYRDIVRDGPCACRRPCSQGCC